MAWWSMFRLPQVTSEVRQSQAAAGSGATSPASSTPVAAPPPCPVPPEYTFSPWQQVHEDRQFQGEWVVQYLHYSRTKTDQCRSTSETESMVQGPYRLWPAVPANRVADVNRPTGSTDGLSGSPLRSSEMLGLGTPGAVGPNPDLIVNSAVTVTTGTLPLVPPFYPGFALLAGAVVATLLLRRRSRQLDPAEGRQVGRVTRPSIPLVGARTLDSIKPGEEWVPSGVEVEWLQAFFGIEETGYGPRTQEAMAAFQREHKIEPDPKVMVGINTYKALWKEHIELVHDRWQRKAEGRRPIEMDVLLSSPLPSDLRAEMNEIDDAYSAYWKAVEGRYQAILRRDSAEVALHNLQIATLTAGGVRLGDVLVLKEKYQPLIDALYSQAEKVKNTANDAEYAKLQAMLAAIDKEDWAGITTAKATLGGRWGTLFRADRSERQMAATVADRLFLYTSLNPATAKAGQPRVGMGLSAPTDAGVPVVSNEADAPAERVEQVVASSTSWTLRMPLANPKITTVYGVTDSLHSSGHDGIDLVPVLGGSTVHAAQAGRVVFVGTDPRSSNGAKRGYGNVVIVDHGNGYQTMYAHLEKFDVKKGDVVGVGASLGIMGSTGFSTAAHLHFMLLKGALGGDANQPWVGARTESPWLFLESEGWGVNFRRIIEDSEFRDTKAMTLDQVRKVLGQSPLFKEYASGQKLFPIYAQNPDETIFNTGRNVDVAQVVYDEAMKHNLNPMLILARMQTEASLLTKKGLTPDHAWVVKGMGFGVPDAGPTDYSKTGLDFQIQSAAQLLNDLFINAPSALDDGPVLREGLQWGRITLPDRTEIHRTQTATIRQGETVTIVSEQVGVENRATWALYKYTPHLIDLNHMLADSLADLSLAERMVLPETPDLYTYRSQDDNIGGGNLLFKESWELVKARM